MHNWLLQNLSDVFNRHQEIEETIASRETHLTVTNHLCEANYAQKKRLAELKAEREWFGAIVALEKILLSRINQTELLNNNYQGLIFAAPAPIFSNFDLLSRFYTGIFTPDAFNARALMPCEAKTSTKETISSITELPLLRNDPIALEQFCLLFTNHFAFVMVLGEDPEGIPTFHFSFEPEVIKQTWATLRSRLLVTNHHHLEELDYLINQFAPPLPDYRLVTEFSRQLLKHLPDLTALAIGKTSPTETISLSQSQTKDTPIPSFSSLETTIPSAKFTTTVSSKLEMELLQALTHEIRTPLTTIRTLTRLLLKRKEEFKPNVVQRLQAIDQECTDQIDRMELIFRAAELESTPPSSQPVQLVSFPLEQVFQESIPRWQKQAEKRHVALDVVLPKQLPKIVSDPTMLDRALTGLMESFTRSLPTGGRVRLQVSTAGNQLKLQVFSQYSTCHNPLKSLGQLLMFQPETGCLSLNLDVTKNIFQALGGKLTVRQRPKQGEELTIFLPIKNSQLTMQI